MINHSLKQTRTSRETDIRSCGGDLGDKTLKKKKIVQKTKKNNAQKWISKTPLPFSLFETSQHVRWSDEQFSKIFGKT